MLNQTYIHIPSVSYITEKKIWNSGMSSWDSFDADRLSMSEERKRRLSHFVNLSIEALKDNNHEFFAYYLPKDEHWRALQDFKKTAYLDIETTGLDKERDDLTMIGVYDSHKVKTFTRGKEFSEFKDYIKEFPLIVTFNGSCFDLPFIENKLDMKFNQLHVDLRFAFKSLGIRGGLKNIEKSFGLERSKETTGLDGLDAVRLWHRYINGNNEALELLKRYNAEDVIGLKILSMKAYEGLKKRTFC